MASGWRLYFTDTIAALQGGFLIRWLCHYYRRPVMAIIYKIQNRLTGRVYIGNTTMTLRKRIYAHRDRLRRGTHTALQDDYNAHGWQFFEVSEVEAVDDSEARQREQLWIEHYGELSYNQWNSINPDRKKPAAGYRERMRDRLRGRHASK
jgi:group I intron endonuclease